MDKAIDAVFDILSFLEAPPEYNNRENLNAENLQISEVEFKHVLCFMLDEGFITSSEEFDSADSNQAYIDSIQITEKGSEYLENHYLGPESGAKVEIDSNGMASSCVIDGKDYSMEISEIVFRHEAQKFPTLEITFANISDLKINAVVGSVMRKKG